MGVEPTMADLQSVIQLDVYRKIRTLCKSARNAQGNTTMTQQDDTFREIQRRGTPCIEVIKCQLDDYGRYRENEMLEPLRIALAFAFAVKSTHPLGENRHDRSWETRSQ